MSKLTKKDMFDLYKLLSRTGALNLAIAKHRAEVFGACLLGIRQEAVSVVPMYALYKKGILMESLVSGDHRTQWGAACAKDILTADQEGHYHAKEILRNHFGRATGGNRGRDGNIHWGCLECRILPFMASDMGRMPGVALGYAEEIKRLEWPNIKSKKKRPVGIAFFGEGAAQQGGIHEAMNWVAASNHPRSERGAPMIFIIVKNQRALFADGIDEHGDSDLAARASGYGNMVGVTVNSDDILTYYDACEKAIDRAQDCVSTLMVVETYRGTGHNQDQITYESPLNKREDLAKASKVFGVEDISEFHEAWKQDPILYPHYLFDINVITETDATNVRKEEEERMEALAREVLAEPPATLEQDKADRSIFPPIKWNNYTFEKTDAGESERMGYNQAFASIVSQLMREDKRVVCFGEDSGSLEGGVLGLTRGLVQEFGRTRIWNATLSEEAIVANAVGRALYGSRPICEFQFGYFWWDGSVMFAAIAPNWYQKKLRAGFISIFPSGVVRTGGSGEYHESWWEGVLVNLAGITVVAPSNAYDLVGLMRAAYEFDGPVAVMLQISAANVAEFENFAVNYATGEVDTSIPQGIPLDPYVIPLGKAKILRNGSDFTVAAYGAAAVAAAKNEADFLEKEDNISVEVIDLRTVHPTDFETIRKSVKKTGRFAIMHEANRLHGAGEHIKSALMENEGFLEYLLTRKVEIICSGQEGDLFIPSAQDLVWARLPYHITQVAMEDEKGRKTVRDIHRSSQLAKSVKNSIEYR